jgi:hypothetical protein
MKYTILVIFIACRLFAQDSYQPLVLTNGSESLIIPDGDWIVAVDSGTDTILGRGKLIGVDGQNIVMLGDSTISVPLDQINTIYIGHYGEVGRRTWKGLKYGARVGFVVGAAWSTYFLINIAIAGPAVGAPPGLFAGIIVMPIYGAVLFSSYGTLIGFLNGLIREKLAKKYTIGPDQWEIMVG